MDINELEDSLPEGFHDADLRAINIDYAERRATLDMRLGVHVEPLEPIGRGQRMIMRDARLVLDGLDFFIIEPPNGSHSTENRVLDVSGRMPKASEHPPVAQGAFVYSFYVANWASYMYFSASNAELHWTLP